MSGLARKLIICAAVDGLIIQPLSSKGQRPQQPIRLRYGDAAISTGTREQSLDSANSGTSFEAFGVIGLITISRLSYLVTITRRQQVAQLFGHPIYVVTEVAVTPCTSKRDAEDAIRSTRTQLERRSPRSSSDDEGTSDDDSTVDPRDIHDEVEDAHVTETPRSSLERNSVAEDVIRKRGSYGRFAQRWFSRSGWTQDQKRTLGMGNSPPPVSGSQGPFQPPSQGAREYLSEEAAPVSSLLPKLLRTVQVLFGSSRSFYFSYDLNITRNLSKKTEYPNSDSPLYTQVDSVFFWNCHLLQPFMQAGQDSLSLPLMQGFIGQRSFVADSSPPQVDEGASGGVEMSTLSSSGSAPSSPSIEKAKDDVELRPSERKYSITLISRRSTKRAGLRYLRRGIDEHGYVANMVETEQILTRASWNPQTPVHSFVQIRGSIPLFWTQSPYSLKPVPVIQHSSEASYDASKSHFERLSQQYGFLQIVNLVEKHGVEEPVGSQYQRNVSRLNQDRKEDDKIEFEWFDFHKACKGMKFENVSQLLLILKDKIEELSSTKQQDGIMIRRQKGVLRTNCMDCLDRTNVCQSSFAKHMLDVQLRDEGIDPALQVDQETLWFNTLWADNGDAVSKQYASTAAMKGDYTRTKKRDYRGALNDLGLSLARFYSGMVNDYFSQAAMDFLLGNVSAKVFDEFETDMMTKDPAVSMAKMREQAISLCQRRCIEDEKEEFHGGWALLSPDTSNTVKSWGMEQIVLLLTDTALYLCRLDWNSDKVSSFERVHLSNITNIRFGTYITSTMSASHMDELRNVGFVVTYQPGKNDFKRTNTRTFSSRADTQVLEADNKKEAGQAAGLVTLLSGGSKAPVSRKLAFKAPYIDSALAVGGNGPEQSEIQQVVTICAEVERMAQSFSLTKPGEEKPTLVEKGEIISLEEAKRNTGILEQLGHSIKKMVWA